MTALAPIMEAFFTDRLMNQQNASAHTIASYRDTFKLLLTYLHRRTGKLPHRLELTDLDAPAIGEFLQYLENVRGNSPASRNTRLAAIHSLFGYASLQAPEHALLISRVLAIQSKRTTKTIVDFLTATNSTRYSPPPTGPNGTDDATMRCSCSPRRPGCESQN
jgi:integrase/recombinase XerD